MSGLSDPAANVTRANEVFRRLGKEPLYRYSPIKILLANSQSRIEEKYEIL